MIYNNISKLADIQPDRSVIPSHTLTFCEDAVYVAEAIEEDYNRIFQEIGVKELAFYESTGTEIVYEAEEKQAFVQKVVDFFKGIWAKIKAAFENILKKFESLSKEVRNKIPNITAQMVQSCKRDKFGKTHQFNLIEKETYITNATNYAGDVWDEFDKMDGSNNQEVKEVKEKLENDICRKVSGFDVSKVSEMTKKIHESLLGEEVEATKDWVVSNIGTLNGIVKNDDSKKVIKKNYQNFKKFIDEIIKDIRKDKGKAITAADNACFFVMKEIVKATHAANNIVMDVCKRRYSEYRNILLRVAICVHGSKDGKPEKQQTASNEAAEVTNRVELIESLFEW